MRKDAAESSDALVRRKLQEFRDLKPGWEYGRGMPMTELGHTRALDLHERLKHMNLVQDVFPDINGGVVMVWYRLRGGEDAQGNPVWHRSVEVTVNGFDDDTDKKEDSAPYLELWVDEDDLASGTIKSLIDIDNPTFSDILLAILKHLY